MASDNGDPQADLVDPSDIPEEAGPGDTLNPSESTDSDEVRNDDGDIVVDPPDDWSEADKFGMTEREEREGESLEYKLAAEEPELPPAANPAPERPVRVHRGQIDGTPEDGDSLFNVDR
jgi:hypothetical protein